MNDYITRIDNFIAPLATIEGVRVARVGGSVRDELLERRVKDADYVVFGANLSDLGDYLTGIALGAGGTSVSPLKLRDGRQAGWRVHKKGLGLIEIVLPRTERSTGPGHRDFKIVLDPALDPAADALRRDFTFNALYRFINPDGWVDYTPTGVADPTGRGMYDLQHRLVNTTHADSFRDDPLRILRALRFVSVLGYDLGTAAEAQMREHADAASGLTSSGNASGTVLEEMTKLLTGQDAAKAMRLMRDTGVMAVLLPELAPMIGFDQGSRYHDMTTDEHTFTALAAARHWQALEEVQADRLCWALLFHDSGKPEAAWVGEDGRKHYYSSLEHGTEDHEVVGERIWREFCARANAPKGLREDVALMIRHHMVPFSLRTPHIWVRRMRIRLGDSLLRDLLVHRICDAMGKGSGWQAQTQKIADLMREQNACIDNEVPASAGDLEINGRDVIELGASGKAVGSALAAVLDEVACDPFGVKLTREWQLEAARRHI